MTKAGPKLRSISYYIRHGTMDEEYSDPLELSGFLVDNPALNHNYASKESTQIFNWWNDVHK